MRIDVFAKDRLIGTVETVHLDVGMCVATGSMQPTKEYDRNRHATEIGGEPNAVASQADFFAVGRFGPIDSQQVWIHDYTDAIDVIEVSFFSILGFDELFRDHPKFKRSGLAGS